MKAIINGMVVLPHEIVGGHTVLYDEEGIYDVLPERLCRIGDCTNRIDAAGCFVTPGFINEHIHGIGGADTMDETGEALKIMAARLPATGVTSFLPTTMTCERVRTENALRRIRVAQNAALTGARVLGAHMEGPFINAEYKGAQAAKDIEKADFSWLRPYKDVVKIITVAPETIEDPSFFTACREAGIIISVGHSRATYEEVKEATAHVASYHITHLYNAMPPLHHRHPGIVGAALTDERAKCELICDNIHVHPAAQLLVYKAKGRDGIILVTDSVRACLNGEGESELGGQPVFVHAGEARLADGTLAGSVVPMNLAVLNFMVNTGAPLPDAVAMASLNPAAALGMADRLGSLEKGKQADMVVLDGEDFRVKKTIVGGKLVYDGV